MTVSDVCSINGKCSMCRFPGIEVLSWVK
jgi:hypothetical protein